MASAPPGQANAPAPTTPPKNERFVRWQKIAIDQLGYALNVILTFAVASLAYCFSLLRDKEFIPPDSAKSALMVAMVAFTFSAIAGLACTLNRLSDFRQTARRARDHPDKLTKAEVDAIGAVTWVIFGSQVFAFAIGAVSLGCALLFTYGNKLH